MGVNIAINGRVRKLQFSEHEPLKTQLRLGAVVGPVRKLTEFPNRSNMPSPEEIFGRRPCVTLNVRKERKGSSPFNADALKEASDYARKTGIYVHIWQKDDGTKCIRYVGQTGRSFRERLNFELTAENHACSKYFYTNLEHHVGKGDLSTVFFSDEEIADMVSVQGGKPSAESLRLLVEQAMTIAYNSSDLLNVHKGE